MHTKTLQKIQRLLALVAPALVALAGAWHSAAAQFAGNKLAANLALLVFAVTAAVALYRRSQGREAAWLNARISEPQEQHPEAEVNLLSADVVLILAAIFLCVIAVAQP